MMIVDASVVLKWFVPEAGSREAVALQTGPHTLAAPSLIRTEVAGAICRATRGGEPRLSTAEADARCARWLDLLGQRVVELVPDETLVQDAWGLSLSLGHPLADCLYLELTQRWNLPFVTADGLFRKKVLDRFPKVRLLKGLELH